MDQCNFFWSSIFIYEDDRPCLTVLLYFYAFCFRYVYIRFIFSFLFEGALHIELFLLQDMDMQRGKPLFLNEERYAALTYMVRRSLLCFIFIFLIINLFIMMESDYEDHKCAYLDLCTGLFYFFHNNNNNVLLMLMVGCYSWSWSEF